MHLRGESKNSFKKSFHPAASGVFPSISYGISLLSYGVGMIFAVAYEKNNLQKSVSLLFDDYIAASS